MLECSTRKKNTRHKQVLFVPFPHKPIGFENMECTWETRDPDSLAATTFNTNDGVEESLDLIQRAAWENGVCIPSSLENNSSWHVFSTQEAIECLSPVLQRQISNRSPALVLAGDSYTKQLFIGLSDILLGRAWNVEIHNGTQRNIIVDRINIELKGSHQNDPSFPNAQVICLDECYGDDVAFGRLCSTCLNKHVDFNQETVVVVGAGIHLLNIRKHDLTKVDQEIKEFFSIMNQSIFVSMPSHSTSKLPPQYRNGTSESSPKFNNALRHASKNKNQPLLNVFQLTRSCFMQNCSFDKKHPSHKSRYVNRWKANLLLNMICDVRYDVS